MQLGEHLSTEEAVAPLAAAAGPDQPLIAVEADRLHGEPGAAGHRTDLQGQALGHLTLHRMEASP